MKEKLFHFIVCSVVDLLFIKQFKSISNPRVMLEKPETDVRSGSASSYKKSCRVEQSRDIALNTTLNTLGSFGRLSASLNTNGSGSLTITDTHPN